MKKWKFNEYVQISNELSELLKNGYSLQETLEIEMSLVKREKKEAFEQLLSSCNKGEVLSDALSNIGFPKWMISFLKISEEKGEFDNGLAQISKVGTSIIAFKKYISKQLMYPLLLFSMLIVLLLFFQFFFYPLLTAQMQTLNVTYPVYTLYIIKLLVYLPLFLCFLFFVILCICLLLGRQYKEFGFMWKLLEKRSGLIKKHIQKYATYIFALYLGELLKGGISLLSSLIFLRKTMLYPLLEKDLQIIKKGLEEGYQFYTLIESCSWVSPNIAWCVKYGELKGVIYEELFRYVKRSLAVEKRNLERFIKIFNSITFLYITISVILLYCLLFFPIFQSISFSI